MPGGGEILVILILVLLLFGPDKLPDLARQLGRGVRELNRMKSSLTDQFNMTDDDDEPRRSKPKSSAQSSVLPPTSTEESGGWESYAAHQQNSGFTRDEDDMAEDFSSSVENDWRNCEEEPTVTAARNDVSFVGNSSHESTSPADSSPETSTKPSAFDLNERPAPPLSVARAASPNRIRFDDETS